MALLITELEQQIEGGGVFWKLNNFVTYWLNGFPGSHVDLHVYFVQSKEDTIAGLDSDIGVIEVD